MHRHLTHHHLNLQKNGMALVDVVDFHNPTNLSYLIYWGISNRLWVEIQHNLLALGLNISESLFNKKTEDKKEQENKEDDFYKIPWNLNINYTIAYNKGNLHSSEVEPTQSLNFSGNIKITKKWKIGFRSGYDFKEKELTYSSVDVYRDLHCWEMLFHWIPIGFHKSYTLTIRVKASVLKDLKLEKKKDWIDMNY